MNVQAANRWHGGRMPPLQIRRELTVGSVIGNRLVSLDRHGVLEHKRGPERQHAGTHGAAITRFIYIDLQAGRQFIPLADCMLVRLAST